MDEADLSISQRIGLVVFIGGIALGMLRVYSNQEFTLFNGIVLVFGAVLLVLPSKKSNEL